MVFFDWLLSFGMFVVFVYLLIFGCVGSSLQHACISLVVAHGLLSSCGMQVFFSICGMQAPGRMGSVVVVCRLQSAWAL